MLRAILSIGLFLPALALGKTDCSIIYDEFESLMQKRYLQQPGAYVAATESRLSEFDFDARQRGVFLLHSERGDAGVIVFRTGQNRYGKLLYRWSEPLPDNKRHLLILEGMYYEGLADGLVPTRFGPLRANAGIGIDLDEWQLVAVDQTVIDQRLLAQEQAAEEENPFGNAFGDPESQEETIVDDGVLGQEAELIEEGPREGLIETDFSVPRTEADLLVWQDESGIYYVGATEMGRAVFPMESMCLPGTTGPLPELLPEPEILSAPVPQPDVSGPANPVSSGIPPTR